VRLCLRHRAGSLQNGSTQRLVPSFCCQQVRSTVRVAAGVPRAGWRAGAHGGYGREEAKLPAGRRALGGLEEQHGAELPVVASAAAELASRPPRLRLVSLPPAGVEWVTASVSEFWLLGPSMHARAEWRWSGVIQPSHLQQSNR